jgi:hypothetical protein
MNETIDFFLENKIYAISFSPIQKNGRGKDDSNYYVDGDTLFEAYKIILDRIIAHNRTHDKNEWLAERVLSNLIQSIYFNKKPFMCMNSPCGAARKILGIDVHGNFYACDNFTGDKDFLIGSLGKGHIKDQLLESPIRKKSGISLQRKYKAMQKLHLARALSWLMLFSRLLFRNQGR